MARCLDSSGWRELARGALSEAAATEAELHLMECEACRRLLLSELHGALSATVTPTVAGPGAVDATLRPDAPDRYQPVLDGAGAPVELGRGGIGQVLLVTDTRLGRDVAMKLLLPPRATREDTRQSTSLAARFLREARVTGQLEHPAIVPVHEVGQREDGSLYYTMRRVRGRTLAQAIAEAKTLKQRLELMPHVLAACQAIAFAHSRHVVHRDLKPQNVMLDRFGETYVVDWGLARVRGQDDALPLDAGAVEAPEASQVRMVPDLTSGEGYAVLGTPAYMAPEQLAGRIAEVDERSDVWGLGAILYEVLTGRVPRELRAASRGGWEFGPVRPVHELEPDAPRELVAVCRKALAEERAQRYASAEQLAADVDAWARGGMVRAYAYRPLDLLRRFVRQYRAPLVVAAVALVVTATLGVQSWRRVQRERNDARRLADLILVDVSKQLRPVGGSLPVLESVTKRALDFYERVGREEGLSPTEREQMATAIVRLSQLNYKLGRHDEARRLARSCSALVGPRAGAARGDQALYAAGVSCLVALATSEFDQGELGATRETLAEAQAWVDGADAAWKESTWLTTQSALASRQYRLAYFEGDFERAVALGKKQVAIDEALLARRPGEADAVLPLASSLLDVQLATLYTESPEAALPHGARAVALLERVPDTAEDVRVLEALGGAHTQQYQVLLMAGDRRGAFTELERGRRVYERLLKLEPETVQGLGDYGVLLLRAGDLEAAWPVMKRADALGARAQYQSSFMQVALLLGHPEEVVARRKALEAEGTHQALWVLAVALAVTGQPKDAAATARAALADKAATSEWPEGALARYARTVPGAVGRVVERFAEGYEKTFLSLEGEESWAPVFERFAADLEALAAVDGGAPSPR